MVIVSVCLSQCVCVWYKNEGGREGEMDGGSVREGQATNVCQGR